MNKQRVILLLFFLSLLLVGGCIRRQYLPIASKQSSNTGGLQITPTQSENDHFTPSSPVGYPGVTPSVSPLSAKDSVTIQPSATISETVSSRVLLPYLAKPSQLTDPTWQLVPQALHGSKENDKFILRLQYPTITEDNDHPATAGFTQQIQTWVNEETNQFIENSQATAGADLTGYMISTYSVPSSRTTSWEQLPSDYQNPPPIYAAEQVIFDGGDPIISVLMEISEYYGGAHPGERHVAINYDLKTGKLLNLDDLFQNSADYLATIAQFSTNELYRRTDLSPQEIDRGAAPLIENYLVWNLTPQGLLITFEEYQVGPYAAGPQRVLIPYDVLRAVLRQDGPLRIFARTGS